MYNIGTVTTTANSNKLVGTGTKWKENINGIQPQQVIQIVVGGIVYNSSIQSIESDTAITLNFPFHAAVKDAKYVILTTMVNSVSSAANYMVALNTSNMHARDVANDWMTKDGVIPMTAPDGTKVNIRTAKEMDKQLDGKFSGVTAVVGVPSSPYSGMLESTGDGYKKMKGMRVKSLSDSSAGLVAVGNDGSLFTATYDAAGKYIAGGWYPKPDNFMVVGDHGLGLTSSPDGGLTKDWNKNGFYMGRRAETNSVVFGISCNHNSSQYGFNLFARNGTVFYITREAGAASEEQVFYTTKNTTKDSNGNLKAASPIIRVFADHVDPNEEAEGVILKKLHTGIYQLHGVLGLHSDASWGGINGGITIPCGINQLPLVYALYDVLEKGKPHPFDGRIVEPDEDGDIVLYTSYRKHDLPQNIQYERFKLYPEFLKEVDGKKVELTPGEPCDIPVGHWVDVRVNMPSNSIYNQKQAEAERLAMIEAERLAQEEAKRIAEEAERVEQEAEEREQNEVIEN